MLVKSVKRLGKLRNKPPPPTLPDDHRLTHRILTSTLNKGTYRIQTFFLCFYQFVALF